MVELTIETAPEHIALAISDNGRGLPEEARERLVEPYVTTRQKGTGLGLAIVKKIMEDHGGQMQLKDRVVGQREQGAVVTLLFPLPEAENNQETAADAEEAVQGATAHA